MAGARLAHGWRIAAADQAPQQLLVDFLRPAVRAIPKSLARRWTSCRISLHSSLENLSGRWSDHAGRLEIALATAGIENHDIAMELLVCVGEALWAAAPQIERDAYCKLLAAEIDSRVPGEIDADALAEKQQLLSSRFSARSRRRLERYARASFAGTAAEYIHCLWHDVSARSGPEHLPVQALRRRLELFSRWFPPNPGYRLFRLE